MNGDITTESGVRPQHSLPAMLSGLHQLENIVGTPQSLLLSSIPLSGCCCTHQEQGTPCLPKSTGRDIHEQTLAQQ